MSLTAVGRDVAVSDSCVSNFAEEAHPIHVSLFLRHLWRRKLDRGV